jgi:hypothetical protein
MLKIVNMIPASMSDETNQDSEPNLAVNPANTSDMVATAFTPAPLGGPNAPIYVSTEGGDTWSLRMVVPGNGPAGTSDITVGFATTGGMLYAGTLNGVTGHMQILRTSDFASTATMAVLVDRDSEDQPWVVAASVVASGNPRDCVYVGNNDFNQAGGQTATVDVSQDAAGAPPPAGFAPIALERGATLGQDGPPVRTALHADGTVYCAFHRWTGGNVNMDVVVTRDDNWGASATPFAALGAAGQTVAANQFIEWNAIMGQERLGGDLSIAVDPRNSGDVWVAWCNRVGGPSGTDWTLHVSHSSDRGQTWSANLRTITNAKNPALAINGVGTVGLAYQQFTGATWDTKLELTADSWSSAVAPLVLHTAPSDTPPQNGLPYLGDYIRLLALGSDFYGVFCGNNTPNLANFPNGVTYQRNADWTNQRLLGNDNTTVVDASIDPFFYHWSQSIVTGVMPRRPPRGRMIRPAISPRGRVPPVPSQPPPGPAAEGATARGKRRKRR